LTLTLCAVYLSVMWFTRAMKSDGITVRFGATKA
jgi:hypothetical protein